LECQRVSSWRERTSETSTDDCFCLRDGGNFAALMAYRDAFQVSTAIIVKVDVSQSFAALMTSSLTTIFRTTPLACWTRKVDVVLGMSGNVLYFCASVCIKERNCLSEWRFVPRSCRAASHLLANFMPTQKPRCPSLQKVPMSLHPLVFHRRAQTP